jgi:asparagine synthase (glutamine-hydrolysing)
VVDPAIVAEMRDTLAHRGPDAAGLWSSEDRRLCLGHRRLAILDLTPEANQPWRSADDRYTIVFNGEIYNFRELKRQLEAAGAAFRTHSDTEVLVEAYRTWGEGCLPRLSGMFAFAIWDAHDRRLFCARDRAGEKPFYYGLIGTSFVFASELKAITRWPDFRREVDYRALADFLTLGFIPDPKSIWSGIAKLPPGHQLTVEQPPGEAPRLRTPRRWWDFRFRPDPSVADWRPAILETLERAAGEMTVADVPVGAFLSGGVDSSSVTAALSRGGHDIRTFTIGFGNAAYDERPWAQQVAALYGTTHIDRVVDADDVGAVFDRLVWHFDEPFNDYSFIPTYYVCQAARREITVALSGDGGDEAFAGYRKYQRLALRRDWGWLLPRPAAAAAAALLPSEDRRRRTLHQYSASAREMLVDSMVLGFQEQALQSGALGELAAVLRDYRPTDVIRDLLNDAPPEDVGLVDAMRYLDFKLTLAGDILVKVDRASMAVSLEVRPVYLHRDLLDLAARIPSRRLADRRQAKRVLKSALEAWLPAPVLYRPKSGFAMPLGDWLRREAISPERLDGDSPLGTLFDPRVTADLRRSQVAGREDATARIHSLMFLDRWARRWLM